MDSAFACAVGQGSAHFTLHAGGDETGIGIFCGGADKGGSGAAGIQNDPADGNQCLFVFQFYGDFQEAFTLATVECQT